MAFKQDTDAYRAAALKAAADYGSAGLAAYNDAVASAERQLAGADRFQADAAARGVPQDAAAELGGIMRNSAEFGIAQARRGRASAQNTAAAQTASVNQYFDMLQASEPFVTAYTQAQMNSQGSGSSEEQDKQILGEARSTRAQAEKDYARSQQARSDLTTSSTTTMSGAAAGLESARSTLDVATEAAKIERDRLAAASGFSGKDAQKKELERRLQEFDKNEPGSKGVLGAWKRGTDPFFALVKGRDDYMQRRAQVIDEYNKTPQVKEGDAAAFDKVAKDRLASSETRVAAGRAAVRDATLRMGEAARKTGDNSREYNDRFGQNNAIRASTEEELAREIAKSRYGYSDSQAYASFADKTAAEQATEARGQNYMDQVASGQVGMKSAVDFANVQNDYIGMQAPEISMMADSAGLSETAMASLMQDERFADVLEGSLTSANQQLAQGNGGQSIQAFIDQKLAAATQLDPEDVKYLDPTQADIISKIVRSRMAGRTPENFTPLSDK